MASAGRVLMTLGVLIFTVVPPLVDLGSTHVGNALWPPHARFHMVWLLVTGSSIGVVALVLLRSRRSAGLAAVLSACVLGGFFLSALFAGAYGGALRDPDGVPAVLGLDANLAIFALAAVLVGAGYVLARPRGSGSG